MAPELAPRPRQRADSAPLLPSDTIVIDSCIVAAIVGVSVEVLKGVFRS